MRAGELRNQVAFEGQDTSARDQYNAPIVAWVPVATVWASIQPLRGGLLSIAQARTMTATATHSVTIRFNSKLRTISPTYRIRVGGAPAVPVETVTLENFTAEDWATFGADPSPAGFGRTAGDDWAQLLATESSATSEDDATPVRYFTIQAGPLDENNRHRMMTFLCTEVTA